MTKSHALAARIPTLPELEGVPRERAGHAGRRHTLWGPDGQCTLRHSLPADVPRERVACTPRQRRAGAHTDWCCVTLLFQRTGEFG